MQCIHVGGDQRHRLPRCSQKLVRMDMWDPNHILWNRGGHMPLLVYIGDNPYRRNESLTRREGGHIRRGWGPSSRNRREHMQRTGKGTWQPRSTDQPAASTSSPSADAAPERHNAEARGLRCQRLELGPPTAGPAVVPPRVPGGLAEPSAMAESLGRSRPTCMDLCMTAVPGRALPQV